jgi:hypothetical protein
MKTARVALILLVMAGCSTVTISDAEYGLSEGVIEGPDHLGLAAADVLYIENYGEFTHTLVVTNDQGAVIAATGLIKSGEETELEVDLQPGTYVFSCRIVAQDDDGNLIDHFEGGMHRTVTVHG